MRVIYIYIQSELTWNFGRSERTNRAEKDERENSTKIS